MIAISDTRPDVPSGKQLLTNAIRENRVDLVQKYFKYFKDHFDLITSCNTESMFRTLLYQIQQFPTKISLPSLIREANIFNVGINPSCVKDDKFLPEFFRFLYNEVNSQWPRPFLFHSTEHAYKKIVKLKLSINNGIRHALIYDYPLDQLVDNVADVLKDVFNQKYSKLLSMVGPNNLKHIKYEKYILLNPNTQMVAALLSSGDIQFYDLNLACSARLRKNNISDSPNIPVAGTEVVKWLVEDAGVTVQNHHLYAAINYCNWDIARYLAPLLPTRDTHGLYQVQFKIGLYGLQTLYELLPTRFAEIVHQLEDKDLILGGDDDNRSCLQYIFERVNNYKFISFIDWLSMVAMDNIRCLAEVYTKTPNAITQGSMIIIKNFHTIEVKLTDQQMIRFNSYLK